MIPMYETLLMNLPLHAVLAFAAIREEAAMSHDNGPESTRPTMTVPPPGYSQLPTYAPPQSA